MYKLFTIIFLLIGFGSLEATSQNPHPLKKVREWFNAEKEKSSRGFHRFATLSTVGGDGAPYSRMIEIVGMSQKNGILFFTHRDTQKVEHLTLNPQAALNIWLPKTLRQVSINGIVSEISREEAQRAWKRTPRFMKLTFLASLHKGELSSPEILQERKAKFEEMYKEDIPMPDTFIGYRFMPQKAIFYEIKPRNFPEKELTELENNKWVTFQLEP